MTRHALVCAAFSASTACTTPPAQPSAPRDTFPVRVVRDVRYTPAPDDGSGKDRLDLYLPQGRTAFPVLVSLHGGGLVEGDKNEQVFVGQTFASMGIGTAVISYHLSPQVTHPRHVRDAAVSVAWVKKHIAEYGGNPDLVFLTGHSAGAYLAGLLITDGRYLAAAGLSPRDVRGVALVSGFYWVERVAPDRDPSIWGHDVARWVDASPAHHLESGVPPVLLLYGDGEEEWRREQSMQMAAALRAAGNAEVAVAEIPGRDHGSIWSEMGARGDAVAERIRRFVAVREGH